MTRRAARIFVPRNPLARALDGPDRIAFDELVRAADVQVAAIADRLLAFVLDQGAALLALLQQQPDAVRDTRHDIAALAADIAATASLAGREALGQVSRGLYLLIQGLDEQGAWRSDVVQVHATSLALILRTPDAPGLSTILANLVDARRSIGLSG